MTTTHPSELARFDPWDMGLIGDPFPIYARYREQDPVHWGTASNSELPGSWYLFRYEANARVLLEAPTFAPNPGSGPMAGQVPPAFTPGAHLFHPRLAPPHPPPPPPPRPTPR